VRDNYNQNSGFVKPDAEEYKKSKNYGGNKKGKKEKQVTEEKVIKNRDFIHRENVNEPIDPEERKKNIIFVITVLIFLILVIITKASYASMQNEQMKNLSKSKWFVSDESDIKKVGYLEIEFGSNGTFDMYKADTQVSCMNGKYSVLYAGMLRLNSDERGFNPPGEWKCKKNSSFKYKLKKDKLTLIYKGVDVTFYSQGAGEQKELTPESEKLNKKYFINKDSKMLVTFYMNNMYIYKMDKVDNIFGENQEVLGEICFSGNYTLDFEKTMIKVDVIEEDYIITSNELWEDMDKYGEYKFTYKLDENITKLTLQYKDKAYEFEKYIIEE
jgi:hypothetical protein